MVAVANAFEEMEAEMAVEMAVALAVVTDAETEVAAQTEVVLRLRWQGCRGVSWCLVVSRGWRLAAAVWQMCGVTHGVSPMSRGVVWRSAAE